jgi:membrane protein involved in colicin uptake
MANPITDANAARQQLKTQEAYDDAAKRIAAADAKNAANTTALQQKLQNIFSSGGVEKANNLPLIIGGVVLIAVLGFVSWKFIIKK